MEPYQSTKPADASHQKSRRQRRPEPKEQSLHTFHPNDIEPNPEISIDIKNCRFLASYNWTKSKEPVIFVPGSPARWMPPSLPATISKDDGQLRKEEALEYKIIPSLTPLFVALEVMEPSYSLLPVSLVTDRGSLRKLFDFVSETKGFESWWRIEVEVVENTMIFTRWEKDSYRFVTGSLDSGYGHEFEKVFLKFDKGLEDSMSHHRIVEYEVAGKKWVVRSEVDGYFEEGTSAVVDQSKGKGTGPSSEHPVALDKLYLARKLLSLDGLAVVQKGYVVSLESIIEVKCGTIRSKGQNNLEKKIAQCWFSQTKHMFIGCHNKGSVATVTEFDMKSALEKWEKRHQEHLKKLVHLIAKIKEMVTAAEGMKCFLVYDGKQKPALIELSASNEDGLGLSGDVKLKFWGDKLAEKSNG